MLVAEDPLRPGSGVLPCWTIQGIAFHGTNARSIGGSTPLLTNAGAIFGLGGALAVYFARNKEVYGRQSEAVLRQLGRTLLINVVYGLTNPRIDNWWVTQPRSAPRMVLSRAARWWGACSPAEGCRATPQPPSDPRPPPL